MAPNTMSLGTVLKWLLAPLFIAMGVIEIVLRGFVRWVLGLLARLFLRVAGRQAIAVPAGAQQDLDQPLSDDELNHLAKWLARHKPHDGWLADIHALDGFLTCIVVGPALIGPGEWLAWMFKARQPPAFERNLPLIMRRMNAIADQCAARPRSYRPLLETHSHLRGRADPLDAWCQGFMTATVLRDRQWEKLLKKRDLALWLYPIWERASRAGDKPAAQASRAAEDDAPSRLTVDLLKTAVLKAAAQRST